MTRRARLGLDRKINVEWLDAAASQVARGATDAEVRTYLSSLLKGDLADTARRGAMDKTVTVLSHIWSRVPSHAEGIRRRALGLLSIVSSTERLALHWAMVIATYPFFADVSTAVGRLLTLQGEVSVTAVRRRLAAQWGDRSTTLRAVPRAIRSMEQWGALAGTEHRGIYRRSTERLLVGGALAELLAEAVLIDSRGRSLPLTHLESHPALFPFEARLTSHQLNECKQFTVHRQGLDMDVVELTAFDRAH